MIRVFAGYDGREAAGYEAFKRSLFAYASEPTELQPLTSTLDSKGTNRFGVLRFLVPKLCGYEGSAIYLDGSDMILRADIAELWALRSDKAVSVVKVDYQTKHSRKYIGTEMESDNRDYPRKNWSSVMVINCAHRSWLGVDEAFIERCTAPELHRLAWIDDEDIGSLPPEWNHLVGEMDPKLVHFTLGIPAFQHYRSCDFAEEWRRWQ